MNIFSKRETVAQNITFIAIMAVINVLISVLIAFTTIIAAILIIFLPLVSVLVVIFCKNKYCFIYLIATILLSVVITLWNIQNTIFYVLPAIITGFIFAYFIKKSLDISLAIIISSLFEVGMMYLSFIFIKAIYDLDMIQSILAITNLQNNDLANYLFPSFMLILAIAQTILSFIVTYNEIKKMQIIIKESRYILLIEFILTICLLSLIIVGYFFSLPLGFLALTCMTYLSAITFMRSIMLKLKYILLIDLLSLIPLTLVFALVYPYISNEAGLLLFTIFPLCWFLVFLLARVLKKSNKKDTINSLGELDNND